MSKIIILLASLLNSTNGFAISKSIYQNITKQVDELRKDQKVPGLSITTFTNKGIQFALSSGHINLEKSKKINHDSSLVPIASVSKILTSLSIYDLIEKGDLKLTTSLSDFKDARYYKIMKKDCPDVLKEFGKIKIEDLLHHRSGLVQDLPTSNMWWDSSALKDGSYPSWKTFDKGICKARVVFKPGTATKYSNLGYNLLSQVVSSLGDGQKFENIIKKNIFKPLKMDNSFYSLTKSDSRYLSDTHGGLGSVLGEGKESRTVLPKVLKPSSYEGSIGVNSSSYDLAKLGVEMLSWSNGNNSEFGFMKNEWSKFLDPKAALNSSLAWSNGLIIFNTKNDNFSKHKSGFICYGYVGTNYGSRAMLYSCPELNWGMSAVFNTRSVSRESFFWAISNTLLEKKILKENVLLSAKVKNWLTKVRKFNSNTDTTKPKKVEISDASNAPDYLKGFLGKYHSDTSGEVAVQLSKDNKLVLFGYELIELGKNKFRFPDKAGIYFSYEPVSFIYKNSKVIGINAAHVLYGEKIQ
jgi:CubicO group peptidase (beta-lactamase class C family)